MKTTENVLQYIDTSEKMNELSEYIHNHIIKSIPKRSIACRIMAGKELVPANISKNPDTEALYILEIAEYLPAKKTITHVLDLGGIPTGQFMESPTRYVIPIVNFSSARYWRNISDMRIDPTPWTVLKFINLMSDGIINSIDSHFIKLVKASIEITKQTILQADLIPSKTAIMRAMQSVMETPGNYPRKMLMRSDDFLALMKMSESAGIDLEIDAGTEFIIDKDTTYEAGVIENILNQAAGAKCEGMEVILCHDDIQPGHIYIFAMPEAVGAIYLGDPRAEIEKRFNMLQWQGDVTGGMNIANVFSVSEIVVDRGLKPIETNQEETKPVEATEEVKEEKPGEKCVLSENQPTYKSVVKVKFLKRLLDRRNT